MSSKYDAVRAHYIAQMGDDETNFLDLHPDNTNCLYDGYPLSGKQFTTVRIADGYGVMASGQFFGIYLREFRDRRLYKTVYVDIFTILSSRLTGFTFVERKFPERKVEWCSVSGSKVMVSENGYSLNIYLADYHYLCDRLDPLTRYIPPEDDGEVASQETRYAYVTHHKDEAEAYMKANGLLKYRRTA